MTYYFPFRTVCGNLIGDGVDALSCTDYIHLCLSFYCMPGYQAGDSGLVKMINRYAYMFIGRCKGFFRGGMVVRLIEDVACVYQGE